MNKIENNTIERIQSETINFLRFPLIVGVVMIHAKYVGDVVYKHLGLKEPLFWYDNVSYLISDIIARLSVPLFFVISAFLFFYKIDFSIKVYKNKLKKRVKSLLVPYLFWNALVLGFYALAEFLSVNAFPGNMKMVSDYSITDYLYSFWNTQLINPDLPSTGPINPQFWFLRDLMLMNLLSPLVYFFIKRLKIFFLLFLGIFYILNINLSLSIETVFFYSVGAYFSIQKYNLIKVLPTKSSSLYVLLYVISSLVLLVYRENESILFLKNINIVLGVVCAFVITANYIRQGVWRANKFLSESSFFIYAYHELVMMFAIKLTLRNLEINSDIVVLCLYIIYPLITIVLGLFLYNILKKYFPMLNKVVTGNR